MAIGKKTGGRQKGTLNKIPTDLRQSITEFLKQNFEDVIREWRQIKHPREKLNFYKDLLRYAIPVLQSTELKTDFDKMTDEQLDHVINELKSIVTNEQATKNKTTHRTKGRQ